MERFKETRIVNLRNEMAMLLGVKLGEAALQSINPGDCIRKKFNIGELPFFSDSSKILIEFNLETYAQEEYN